MELINGRYAKVEPKDQHYNLLARLVADDRDMKFIDGTRMNAWIIVEVDSNPDRLNDIGLELEHDTEERLRYINMALN